MMFSDYSARGSTPCSALSRYFVICKATAMESSCITPIIRMVYLKAATSDMSSVMTMNSPHPKNKTTTGKSTGELT